MDYKPFLRPRFTDGMLLCAQDLQLMQSYGDDKRRLINHMLLGWGVAEGLKPTLEGAHLTLTAGFALDRAGRELVLEKKRVCLLSALFAETPMRVGNFTVCLEYDEECDGEAALLLPDPSKPGSAPARVRECSRLRIYPAGEAAEMSVPVAHLRVKAGEDGTLLATLTEAGRFYPSREGAGPEKPEILPQTTCGELLFGSHIVYVGNGIYRSGELSHGLGPGRVRVTLSVLGRQDGQKCLITGDASLFGRPVQCAAQVLFARGTFVAAVRCAPSAARQLRLLWEAQRVGGTFMTANEVSSD